MALLAHLTLILFALALHITTTTANLPPGVAGPRWPSFFEAPEFHLNIAKRDIEATLKPNNDVPAPRWPTIFEAPGLHLDIVKRDIDALLNRNGDVFGPRWPTIFEALEFHLNIAVTDALNAAKSIITYAEEWVLQAQEGLQRDPVGTVLKVTWDVTKVVVVFLPGLIWGPTLGLLGFEVGGVGRGTVAASVHSMLGRIASGSWFAFLQSAGARGYGAPVMDALFRLGMVVKEAGTWFFNNPPSNGTSTSP
ncbi:hypothetical protein F4802DRAFT_600061 [Xylaria palmicola]|nr:hypothetical protein F4802DRAFT_600061 [Xylaria palmicola]